MLSLIMFAGYLVALGLLAGRVPDAVGNVIGFVAAVSVFGAVILLLGWIFQPKPTDPPRPVSRRLRAVTGEDEAGVECARQTRPMSRDSRRAA